MNMSLVSEQVGDELTDADMVSLAQRWIDFVREWRLRRDHPDIEYRKGKPKERGKYLSPPGRGNMIYFVPGLTPDLLQNIVTP
jgi:hypothetical protein